MLPDERLRQRLVSVGIADHSIDALVALLPLSLYEPISEDHFGLVLDHDPQG
jgi:hypothetical protein